MFTGIDPTIDGRPKTANAYVHWKDIDSAGYYDITESFTLRRNATANGWYGVSSNEGDNVSIHLFDTADRQFVDVLLNRRSGTIIHSTITWLHVLTTFRAPWGTKLLTWLNVPMTTLNELQVLA